MVDLIGVRRGNDLRRRRDGEEQDRGAQVGGGPRRGVACEHRIDGNGAGCIIVSTGTIGGRNPGGSNIMRAVVIRRGEDGYWVAEVPSLPGCISQGRSRADAITNIKEAIDGWIEAARANGQPVPDEDYETQIVCV